MRANGVGGARLSIVSFVSLAALAVLQGAATGAPPAQENAVVEVKLKNYAFVPTDIKANVGDTIKFTNEDADCHTVTRGTPANAACTGSGSTDEKDFDVVLNGSGTSTQITVNTEGSFTVYCKPHAPEMKATVTVSKASAPPQRTPGFEAVAAFAGMVGAAAVVAVVAARKRKEE